jgi:hypothetical protein
MVYEKIENNFEILYGLNVCTIKEKFEIGLKS